MRKKLSLNTETLQILERIGLQPASMISIGGSNLLQGQKRIIEMLRAVYCDFDMIVFDEPLIFLDAEKRDIFRSMIRKNLADKTILIIFNEERLLQSVHGLWIYRRFRKMQQQVKKKFEMVKRGTQFSKEMRKTR